MNAAPNHRNSECQRCDNCNHAEWTRFGCLHVYQCSKHYILTKDSNVCDDWEEEQLKKKELRLQL